MVNIGEKIKARRLELEWSQAELARRSGVDPSLLSHIESGKRRVTESTLWAISGALGWSPERFFSSDSNVSEALPDNRRIPVLDYVQAGQWMAVSETPADLDVQETIGTNMEYPPSVFALRIRGDSMAPEFVEGDLVVIAPTVAPMPGDCVVATDANGEATFKKYRNIGVNMQNKNVFELVAINPDYGTMRSDAQQIAIVGTMLEHRRYRRR